MTPRTVSSRLNRTCPLLPCPALPFQADATSIALRANLLFALVFFFIVMPFIFMSLFTAGGWSGTQGWLEGR